MTVQTSYWCWIPAYLPSYFISRCEFFDFKIILFTSSLVVFSLPFFTASVTTLLNSLLIRVTDHIDWSLSSFLEPLTSTAWKFVGFFFSISLDHFESTQKNLWGCFHLIILLLVLRLLNILDSQIPSTTPFLVCYLTSFYNFAFSNRFSFVN